MMAMVEEVSLAFLGRSMEMLHEEMRAMRKEQRDVRTIVLSSIDQMRRVRDDLELMIRSETMGHAAHMETVVERNIGDLRNRLIALEHAAH